MSGVIDMGERLHLHAVQCGTAEQVLYRNKHLVAGRQASL